MACSRPCSTLTSFTSGLTLRSSASVPVVTIGLLGRAAQPAMKASAQPDDMTMRRISVFLHAGRGSRGSIVAIGNAEARLGLLGHQSFAACIELVDGDGFDHVSLTRHQGFD